MANEDADLVVLARAGDKAAFEWLVLKHRPEVLRLVQSFWGASFGLAEDVTQDAFLIAYLDIGRLRKGDRFGSWVTGIALNLCRRLWREQRLRQIATASLELSVPRSLVDELVIHNDLVRRTAAALNELPKASHRAVLLWVDGRSYQEISGLLHAPLSAVRTRMHKARAYLRRRVYDEQLSETSPSDERSTAMIPTQAADVMTGRSTGRPEEARRLGILVLADQNSDRALCIWMQLAEAEQIAMHLAQVSPTRPLTYEFTSRLLEAADVRVERVEVSDLSHDTYYANVFLRRRRGKRLQRIDARPSDAVNLALRAGAPIFVEEGVWEKASRPMTELTSELAEGAAARSLVEQVRREHAQNAT